MLVFLVAVVSLNCLNATFWVSKAILNMKLFGPCMVENSPFTFVYLAYVYRSRVVWFLAHLAFGSDPAVLYRSLFKPSSGHLTS